jgi:hypothetical protein
MTPLRLAASLAACLLAPPALAFDGRYGTNCNAEVSDDPPLVVQGDTIRFAEASCRMTNPVGVRDMSGAILFDMVCEGQADMRWTDRALMQPSHDGGLILVWRGFAYMLPRCP